MSANILVGRMGTAEEFANTPAFSPLRLPPSSPALPSMSMTARCPWPENSRRNAPRLTDCGVQQRFSRGYERKLLFRS
jgi:hypothetical protein